MQQVQADSAPAIVITEVNGRSQLPGSVVEVYAKFTCPNGGTDCITSMYATATSANPNIKYQSSSSVENISSTTCPNQECHLVLSAEFYVPLEIEVEVTSPSGNSSSTSAKTTWDYPVVVDPHVVPQALWN